MGAKDTGTKKRRKTPAEKARQAAHTDKNKRAKQKRRVEWEAKRAARARMTDGASMGASVKRNRDLRAAAMELPANRIVVTVGKELKVEHVSNVGRLKLSLGIPTKYKEPEGV